MLVIFNNMHLLLIFAVVLCANCHRIKELSTIQDHINNQEHDSTFDHQAFLGAEESKSFDKLEPEESKSKLKQLIISNVDSDRDGMVSVDEMKKWISHVARLSKEKERDEYFPMYLNSTDVLLDYETYINKMYGDLKVDELDDVSKANLEIMHMQDERKWKMADENNDKKLDRNEILVFQHPEDYPKMRSLVIQETMEIADKNKDGFLDLNEYINDFWPSTDKNRPEEHLVKQEEETFHSHRDINKDNKLDLDEVGEWLMPTNYDPIDAETKHLFFNADSNKDNQLSLDEILDSYDLFVGSQATDYGNSLKHEEL